MSEERVLVLGGCGFVGRVLVRTLLNGPALVEGEDGDEKPSGYFDQTITPIEPLKSVRVMDLADNEFRGNPKVEYVRGDLCEPGDLLSAMKEITTVFHLATPNPLSLDRNLMAKVNVEGTQCVVDACKKSPSVKRLVYTSSASVVFHKTGIRDATEEAPIVPPSQQPCPYTRTKGMAEKIVLSSHGLDGLSTVAIRPHSIFGPGDALVSSMLKAAKAGKSSFIIGNAENIVDFTYVDNVAWGLILAARALRNSADVVGGKTYNITNDAPMRFWSFFGYLCGETGYSRPRYKIPFWILEQTSSWMEFFLGDSAPLKSLHVRLAGLDHSYSCDLAKRELGYYPVVSVAEGVRRTLAAVGGERVDVKPQKSTPLPAWESNKDDMWRWTFLFSWLFFTLLSVLFAGLSIIFINAHKLTSLVSYIPVDFLQPRARFAFILFGGLFSVLSFVIAFILREIRTSTTFVAHRGLPLIGSIASFAATPLGFLSDLARQCGLGGACEFWALHKRVLMFTGEEGLNMFFNAPDTLFSQKEAYAMTVPAFGKGVVYDAPTLDIRAEQFHFAISGLSEKHMHKYASFIEEECALYFDKLGNEGEVKDFLETTGELVLLTASRCLLGKEIRENLYAEVAHYYHDIEEGFTYIGNLWPNFPCPKHWRRNKALKQLQRIFSSLIEKRRVDASVMARSDGEEIDLLEVLLKSKYKAGRNLTDHEICGLVVTMLFGGQHTSTVTITWLLVRLLSDEGRVEKALEEQRTVPTLSYENVTQKLPFLTACILETLRLHPPLCLVMRYATADIPWKGHLIKKGTLLVASPFEAGRSSNVYPNPSHFEETRWIDKDMETWRGTGRFVSFGTGRHSCLGRRFALLQIRTIMSYLLRNFELTPRSREVPPPNEGNMVVGPVTPISFRFKRRSTPIGS